MTRRLRASLGAALWAAALATEPSVSKRYRLEEFAVGPELAASPLPRDVGGQEVELDVRKTGLGAFSFTLKVVNVIRFDGVSSFNSTLAPFFGLQVSGVTSTRMMGPQQLMQVEGTFQKKLWGVEKWMATDQTLLMQGPTVQLEFREIPGDRPAAGGKTGAQAATKQQQQQQPRGSAAAFCPDSPPQLCRMICQPPSCAEDQCAMRNGRCCDVSCVARASG